MVYATAEPEDRYRPSSTTDTKNRIVERLVERHRGDSTLVIGQYLDQLDELAEHLDVPSSRARRPCPSGSGCTRRSGAARCRRWSFPRWPTSPSTCPRRPSRSRSPGRSGPGRRRRSDLADPRPKADGRGARAAVVARDTVDQDYAAHRQRFLAEQGYAYRIIDADDVLAGDEI